MNSLIKGNCLRQIETSLADLVKIFLSATSGDLSCEINTLVFLQKNGINARVQKNRGLIGGEPNKSDSYILGYDLGGRTLGVKIHPDTFHCCKRVYEDIPLLRRLTQEQDIPQILHTEHIQGFRVVFYIWDECQILPYHLDLHPSRIPAIQDAFHARIISLRDKGLTLVCAKPDDFTFCPAVGSIRLLDPNKLWVRNQPVKIATPDGAILGQNWLQDLLKQK